MELPPMSVVAARIRAGETHRQIAYQYRVDPQGLANRLRSAGYRFDTGEVERDARRREIKEHLRTLTLRWWEPWMEDAACATVDPELWFPDKGESTKPAKQICAGCPALEACGDYATRNKEWFGVWAGQSEMDRRRTRKQVAA